MAEQWFGPAEMARRLGVSPKALRVYEREGLVTPLRTGAGWRAYGPDQAARLHQVLALKRLGLPLKRMGELLAGRLASLDAVLALQQQVLTTRRDEADRGLALLAAARATLARDGGLSPDALTQLTRETAMTEKMNDEMAAVFRPLTEKHFSPEEQAAIVSRKFALDQAQVNAEWDAMFAQARTLMASGDPATPEAVNLAKRWMLQVDRFTGGAPETNARSAAMWKEALDDPEFARRSPLTPEMMAFVGQAWRHAQAQGAKPE